MHTMTHYSPKNCFDYIRIWIYTFLCTYSIKRILFLHSVKKKPLINVVFFASNVSMWRYQHLYELMSKHPKFNVHIVLAPFIHYTKEQQCKDLDELKKYFDSKKIEYHLANSCDLEFDINPDILFYPQYYFDSLEQKIDAKKFRNRLLCAYPYCFKDSKGAWAYDNFFHNAAWKLFYPTQSTLEEAKQTAFNKGRNVVVTGYPNADDFLSSEVSDVWKKQKRTKKKVIWAPHFTIEQGITPIFYSTFLKYCKFMQNLATTYSDEIQLAFKPHPRLLMELYKHKNWGKSKADEYYYWWDNQDNTQLNTGNFIDLFKTSDAMIHDSGSFSVEYFYTKKPAMYLSYDLDEIKKEKNEVGKAALDAHYIGKHEEDIIKFVENVVLRKDDPLKEHRNFFFNKYLLPPNGKTVAQNTIDDILNSLNNI